MERTHSVISLPVRTAHCIIAKPQHMSLHGLWNSDISISVVFLLEKNLKTATEKT